MKIYLQCGDKQISGKFTSYYAYVMLPNFIIFGMHLNQYESKYQIEEKLMYRRQNSHENKCTRI